MQNDDTLTAMEFAGLSVYETWMHYCNMGGWTDYFEFDAYLYGVYTLDADDADLVSQAVNELIDDIYPADEAALCRAPYSWTVTTDGSVSDPVFHDVVLDGSMLDDVLSGDLGAPGEVSGGIDWLDGLPVRVPVDDLVGPRSRDGFGSLFLTGLDVRSLSGRPGVPLPPGAPLELLGEILDSGVIGRIVSSRERN
jgi:hypothetical protein